MESILPTNDVVPVVGFTGSYPGKVEEVRKGGYIFTPRLAKKPFISCVSQSPINTGETYYSVVKGGGGLGWFKHPDRIHLTEIYEYLAKWGF